MIFLIKKVSDLCGDNRPCKIAKLYSTDNCGIKLWTIQIESLDELMVLQRAFRKRLIIDHEQQYKFPVITIYDYDSYIE